ncbi:SOG2 [Candida oxycetoniae]|uniref:SOG2 n=1 Tax=Candida oxycetoniae TaxID=497107 RepID=A0AAI9WYX3_9ASCO|nr:SOG2 [Candida oxycetoniae]KAI3405816.2 SOG2 [Candida oxycetoniae]
MSRTQILSLLRDQKEVIIQQKTIKLNAISFPFNIYDLFETIHEYLYSFDPPIQLEKLSIQSNGITELPLNIHKISRYLKYLDLHNNSLTEVADSFFENFPSLEILDLSSNKFSSFPDSIASLHNLIVLSVKDNFIKFVPPKVGEMKHLNLIELFGNPLIIPSIEKIRALQHQSVDLEWVEELKKYLKANATLIKQGIEEAKHGDMLADSQSTPIHDSNNVSPDTTPPRITRSLSMGDTSKSKLSRASKRMGLVIKKAEENGSCENLEEDEDYQDFNGNTNPPPHNTVRSASAAETTFQISSSPSIPISSTTLSIATNSTADSPSKGHDPHSAKSSNNSSHTTKPLVTRSRSNTFKEIDQILEKSESVDTEHKSNAYFRRLSTLQEQPLDENDKTNNNHLEPKSTRHNSETSSNLQIPVVQQPQAVQRSNAPPVSIEGSPTRVSASARKYPCSVLIKVSRKILFAFSELHSSIRRFTGFCTDKKVAMKMVSLLYTTKSNIDTLVENLELVEENGGNSEIIAQTLHTCIASFKLIMNLLHENIGKFVSKIDVCFIRMLYLSVFGSFNELQNAFKLLSVKPNAQKNLVTEQKQKMSINTNVGTLFDEVDEKLYTAIKSACFNAQSIFTELNKDVNRGASENAAAVSPTIAAKIKELTNLCALSLEIIKRLTTRLVTIRNNASQTTKKMFVEDVNQFLKSIVQILATVKGIVVDLPILEDVRASMSSLTKTAKEVTYMLEISSYKALLTEPANAATSQTSQQSQNQPLFTPTAAHAPSLPSTATFATGPVPPRSQIKAQPSHSVSNHQESLASSVFSMNGPSTAPPQSMGQALAKHGINPFDKLIQTKNEGEN